MAEDEACAELPAAAALLYRSQLRALILAETGDVLLVSMIDAAIRSSGAEAVMEAVQRAYALVWERLHAVHWRDVASAYRAAHSLLCVLRVVEQGQGQGPGQGETEALRLADLGLLLGLGRAGGVAGALHGLLQRAVRGLLQGHDPAKVEEAKGRVVQGRGEAASEPAPKRARRAVPIQGHGLDSSRSLQLLSLTARCRRSGSCAGLVPRVGADSLSLQDFEEAFLMALPRHADTTAVAAAGSGADGCSGRGRCVVITGAAADWPCMLPASGRCWADLRYIRKGERLSCDASTQFCV